MFQLHDEVGEEERDLVFVLVQSDEQIVHGPALARRDRGVLRQTRQLATIGKREPEEVPIGAGEQASDQERFRPCCTSR